MLTLAGCRQAEIGPVYSYLTAAQKGVDAMYSGILEDVLSGCAGVVFGDRSTAAEAVPAHLSDPLPPPPTPPAS